MPLLPSLGCFDRFLSLAWRTPATLCSFPYMMDCKHLGEEWGPVCLGCSSAVWHLMTNVASSFRSIPRMTVALRIAIGMCFVLYSAVGIGGYLTFGSSTEGNIVITALSSFRS